MTAILTPTETPTPDTNPTRPPGQQRTCLTAGDPICPVTGTTTCPAAGDPNCPAC